MNKYHFKNIGWSLGNACPFHCVQCYSRSVRKSGKNLDKVLVDRIFNELSKLSIETINLGGNEPIYTNGLDPKKSLLPYIIDKAVERGVKTGITTAGPTLIEIEKLYPEYLKKINDVDISLDSPWEEEHDRNRGQKGLFKMAIQAVEICKKNNLPRTLIMCAMNWNFTNDRIVEYVKLGKLLHANVRFNPIKRVESFQKKLALPSKQFFEGLRTLLQYCDPVDLSDPLWAVANDCALVSGCPCGTSSFRINSITPEGKIPVSPCVYLHDFKCGDLTTQSILEILIMKPFQLFKRRKFQKGAIKDCDGCSSFSICGGGCAARTYLHQKNVNGSKKPSLFKKDPYCLKEDIQKQFFIQKKRPLLMSECQLVHQGYLCTGIFSPR